MCKKSVLSIVIISLAGMPNRAAGFPIMVDIGGGNLKAGWSCMPDAGYGNDGQVTVEGVGFTASCYLPGDEKWRSYAGGDLGGDYFDCDNGYGNPDGSLTLEISNLPPGSYVFTSYHNNAEPSYRCPLDITVTGSGVSSSTTATNVPVTTNTTDDNNLGSGTVEFVTTDSADVVIHFIPTCDNRPDGMMCLNGFILDTTGPIIQFESASSGAVESVSPAELPVLLHNAQAGQIYTVDYAATDGTATAGTDYWLEPDTLTFNPGQTTKIISMDIFNDHVDEENETVIVSLSGPTGPDVQLGTAQHTYTIIDPRPDVQFADATGSQMENVSPAAVAVDLTHPWPQIITVDYAVIDGTATAGADYTLLGDGTLTFDPCQTTKDIGIAILDDILEEGPETIVLTLSNPTNAKLGTTSSHTFTINDNERLVLLEEFAGDSFSAFNHASTIAETRDGTLVVAWYGGSSEGADDVSIWVTTNAGSGWTPRIEVDDGSGDATWNPVLFQPSTGPLLLYFKYSGSPGSWRGAVRKSYDNGSTWSGRILLPSCSDPYLSSYGGRFIGPVKNKPLELPDGALLCGSSTEHDGWQVHMEIARGDYTNDFELIGPLGPIEAIQPTFLVHDDSYTTIQALCRAAGSGSPTPTTWSYDAGQTWTSLSTIGFETSKGLDAVTINNLNSLKNRWHILAYNPSGRYPLRIATSQDGVNWDVAIDNLDDAGGSMDYPAIIQTSNKMLHVTYSWNNHQKIKHVVLNPYILLSEPTCVQLPGDIDGDGIVDWDDLEALVAYWLQRCRLGEWCWGSDINQDRKVDAGDFALLAAQWFESCP